MAKHSSTSMIIIISGIFAVLSCLLVLTHCAEDETQKIKYKDIVLMPWVDSYNSAPKIEFQVCYRHDKCVEDDAVYTIQETQERPFVSMAGYGLDKKAGYVMVMVDTDAPNPDKPIVKPELHWLVHSISGNLTPYQDMGISGNVIVPYMRPSKSYFYRGVYGLHRMYILVFKQEKPEENITCPEDFKRFSLRNFTRDYKLGLPVAGCTYHVDFTSGSGYEDNPSNHL